MGAIARTLGRAALFLGAMGACGGEAPAPPATGRAALHIATRADPAGRTQVASVDGEPVYADCVAAQAAAGLDRDAALARCIDFELLAQEARRRGLVGDADVLAARRTEMVRAVVEAEFAPTLDDPSDVPAADVRWLWDSQLSRRYNRPELRRATYCRVPVAAGAPAGGREDQAARQLAGVLHDALAQMRGLQPATFAALCAMTAGGREVKTTSSVTSPFSRVGRHAGGLYAAPFVEAAFAIAAPGGVSPPTRTRWGWDILLLTEVLPAESRTLAEAEPEIRASLIDRPETAEYRRRKFEAWLAPLLAGHRIALYPGNLPDDQAIARAPQAGGPEKAGSAGSPGAADR